ncbi:outer membrane protein assembly factor BamD [Neotamlana laminarinivorans]|uniref:Outer membrane protein assembly factor BamD n=1 Tax=Neotamlana laminarinivorans TaxID=2883124 RepID=A0A9X1HY87_9FLAO|nr:outer membrane protein assembly factor BamD [Tamlana laminarinivorans]MCB4797480.1 outer membrane protein assembly factor BamD [Tamlana laminarinivorans]
MRNFFYIVIVFTFFTSCSEYQKALKSEEIATKFKLGEELYNAGKYAKANKLFAQIVPEYRGKPQAEKLMFLYSNSLYKMKDYYTAGYQFERFVSSYPNSEKVEEAAFLAVKSYYILSPVYSKDQTETISAIEKLQEFINLYPESKYASDANKLVQELDLKLQRKAFEIAKQYKLIAPGYSKDFNAAIKSFDNFLFDYPGTPFREEAMFLKLDSMYQLAINSREYTNSVQEGFKHIRKERLVNALDYSETFKKSYANSEHIETVNAMIVELDEALKNYNSTKVN